MDKAFRLKISIVELIVRYELTDFDFILMRIKQIQNDFKSIINELAFLKEKQMIHFIKLIITNSGQLKKGKAFEEAESFISQLSSNETDDSEIINYSTWLASKLSK